jgi:prolyl 4-hydroxylase
MSTAWCPPASGTVVIQGRNRPFVVGDSIDHGAPLALVVRDVLSHDECQAIIQRIDGSGPTVAPITTSTGFELRPDLRNNTRVMFDDGLLASQLFDRLSAAIPPTIARMRAVGANERFRCYRYESGQRFAPHYDGAFRRSDEEVSLLTLIVYLNEGFRGGATAFLDHGVDIVPRTGMALLFQHRLLHEGCAVTSGVKYALRTDVMYRG